MLFGTGRVGRQTPNGGRTGYGATLPSQDLVFTTDTLPTGITFTRSTTGSYFNSSGVLSSAAINTPRFDHDTTTPFASRGLLIEEARTNSLPNSTMVGAVPGTPGTPPTGWAPAATGLTIQQVATGTLANGLPYVDYKFSGTTGATFGQITLVANSVIAAVNAQVWNTSVYLALIAGSFTNVNTMTVLVNMNDAVPTSLGSLTSIANVIPALTSTIARFSGAVTLNQATTAFVRMIVGFGWSAGVAVDFTIRIAAPQFELGAFASSFIPTSTVAVTRGADIASMPVSAAWFTNGIGTTIVDATNGNGAAIATNFWLFEFNDGTITAPIRAYHNGGFNWTVGSLNDFNAVSKAVGVNYKFGLAHDAAGFSASVDGSTTAGDSTVGAAAYATYTSLRIGARSNNTFPFNGYIRRLRYYPRRMSVVELGATTT